MAATISRTHSIVSGTATAAAFDAATAQADMSSK